MLSAQLHAVCVHRERRTVVEDDVALGIERHLGQAGRREPTGRAHLGQPGLCEFGVEARRLEPHQPENHCTVGGVPLPGKRQRAAKLSVKRRECRRIEGGAAVLHRLQERRRRRHRSHGVGRRRADADLEDVDHADEHVAPFRPSACGDQPNML